MIVRYGRLRRPGCIVVGDELAGSKDVVWVGEAGNRWGAVAVEEAEL